MIRHITLTAADGFEFAAYVAEPATPPKACLVILPEIFGINSHIRSVADRYAALGYLAIAPSVFDRAERGLDLGYTDADVLHGQALMRQLTWGEAVVDIEAAGRWGTDALDQRHGTPGVGKLGIVGYCWGGTAAWVTASRSVDFACAVSYYGNAITTVMDDRPKIPMLLHWGERDHLISLANIERVAAAAPDATTHVYPTGHGFNCEQRTLYHAESAALALERTLAFLARHLG